MKGLILSLLIIAGLASPALAEIKGCYERVYDAAHLKRHRGQVVTMMRLQMGLSTDIESDRADSLWAKFRNGRVMATQPLECSANQRCFVEEDGGSFHVDETADGVKITNEGYIRFGDEDDYREVAEDAEHRVFLLKRKSSGACR